ncbi:formate dehydrogenase 2, mitochondrial-like, partial [Dendrobium catenatum]|uniref:formate dehydrogenase 2, mitochondrial-like n=1 Tax=Dendrobium catenatum TaxID=906689 RepID=UPI0009F60CE2
MFPHTVPCGPAGPIQWTGLTISYELHLNDDTWIPTVVASGYSGDVWNPQPAPKDHPWRYMPNHAMTPHISGTTIDGQLRYAAGVKDMLDKYFKGEDFPQQN